MRSIGGQGLNLAQDMKPPKSLYVEVSDCFPYVCVVMVTHACIMTSFGGQFQILFLSAGSQFDRLW